MFIFACRRRRCALCTRAQLKSFELPKRHSLCMSSLHSASNFFDSFTRLTRNFCFSCTFAVKKTRFELPRDIIRNSSAARRIIIKNLPPLLSALGILCAQRRERERESQEKLPTSYFAQRRIAGGAEVKHTNSPPQLLLRESAESFVTLIMRIEPTKKDTRARAHEYENKNGQNYHGAGIPR